MADVGLSQCNNEINRCQEGMHCPPDVGPEPVTCVIDDPIKDCQVTFHGVCKLCKELYYLENGACFPCNSDCTLCKNTSICGVCLLPDFMQPTLIGKCKQTCSNLQNNQYCDDSVPRACIPGLTSACKCGVSQNCASCSSSNECETCLPGFKKTNNQCVQCATGYYAFQTLCLDDGTGNRDPTDSGDDSGSGDDSVVVPGEIIPSSNKISVGAIIGIVIAVVLLIGGICGGVIFYVLKRKQKRCVVDMNQQRILNSRYK